MSDKGLLLSEKNIGQGEIFNQVESCEIGPTSARQRREEALQVRQNAALFQKNLPVPGHPCNGDESLFVNKIGNFSKGLLHNHLGEVNLNAYNDMIRALSTGNPEDFEFIPLGGATKLTSPQTAYAFELVGPDTHHLSMIPAPAFSSAWNASEMAELYWLALTRDVPFSEYDTNPTTLAAASELSGFSDFRGPKDNGVVTTGTLFRGNTPGDITGPYISQFLWKDIPYGATTIVQRYRTTVANVDYMTSYEDWLNTQNGFPSSTNQFDPTPRYIRNNRDLGEWNHRDFTFQGFLGACLILLSYGSAALAPSNPYLRSATQSGRSTFGAPHILDFVARATRAADMAAWYQKWLVHRRLRPEEFGGRVHNLLTGAANYPINQELLNSQAVEEVFKKFGTYLLPQAYAEGCPTHSAYPAGHACVAGAGVTMLKAFFKESFTIPNPVVADADGLSLLPYSGSALTVGGELNKLASNVGIGRNAAGVHWRSDGEGLKLGEAVAIGILQDYRQTYNENFNGFSFTKFDGTTIVI
ncbi:PAP2 superfamily protein [Sporotomaculum syntrophicum]|uniref:PAP2 superfamily protein n=1 Tax=Sporotomaculum syntrophicum TaxID=182264 RepID=A0A9D3AZ33_9FIRM|nr:vanadium-dependent haloperoxidase [Sporotomaculum syntrophicum]KAF1086682.1 PAP2 superfamily protein [Sporotomaculum syntrophicum]